MSSPTCVQCGAELFNDPTRCGVCGARQPAPAPAAASAPAASAGRAGDSDLKASDSPAGADKQDSSSSGSSRGWIYAIVAAVVVLGGYQYWNTQKEAEAKVEAARAEAEATRKRLEAEKNQQVQAAQERARQEAEARVREAEEKAQQATEAATALEKAARCADARECIGFMLAAAEPRQPQVFQAAATRFSELGSARGGSGPSASERNTARDLNRRGLEDYKRGNVSAAIESFSRASRLDPADAEISGNLGYVLVKAQRLDEASKALSQSIQADPRRSGVWHAVAEYFGPSRADSAVRALLLSYEVSKTKDQVLASYEKLVTTATSSDMRPIYAQAVARIKAR